MAIAMNAAERENDRNIMRRAIEREHEERALRCWTIEYRYASSEWMEYSRFQHLAIEVPWQLKYLRSKRPECNFRAVKKVTVTYTRTYIKE